MLQQGNMIRYNRMEQRHDPTIRALSKVLFLSCILNKILYYQIRLDLHREVGREITRRKEKTNKRRIFFLHNIFWRIDSYVSSCCFRSLLVIKNFNSIYLEERTIMKHTIKILYMINYIIHYPLFHLKAMDGLGLFFPPW